MEVCSSLDYNSVLKDYETQELESPGGIATCAVYENLLAIYILQNDLCSAKFLWKRIPQPIKSSSPDLTPLWNVGQKLWKRDFKSIYEALKRDWSDHLKPTINKINETVRERAFNLISGAYSSIHFDAYAEIVGMSKSDALEAAVARGWRIDKDSSIVLPVKTASQEDASLAGDEHLSILTDYVSYLEN